jgi:hypothetical protein
MISYPDYKVLKFTGSRISTNWYGAIERKLGDSREHIQNVLLIITFKVENRSFGEAKKTPL